MAMKRKWPVVVLVVFAACTVGEAPPEGPRVPPADAPPVDTVAMDTVVEEVPGVPPLDEAEVAAEELLGRARLAYEAAELGEALDLARRTMRDYPRTRAAAAAAWVGARSAFALERWSEAETLAETFLDTDPGPAAEEARALAELARDEMAPPADAPVRLGVVLPRTGPQIMVRYADWLLEGIQLAVGEAEVRERRPIELVVADDAGGTRTREAVAEVEGQGAIAVIGPLMPQQLPEAAGARSGGALLTVSPTIPEHPLWPYVYTVNTGDARGAQELGRYAAELGFAQAALLYPRTPSYERKASAFAVEFEAMGGQLRTAVPYDSGTTTFSSHMQRILTAVAPDSFYAPVADSLDPSYRYGVPPDTAQRYYAPLQGGVGPDTADPWMGRPPQEPFALFVAAPDRDVRQIAPQIAFYGLDSAGVQVFGDEAWASATVRRVVPRQDLEGVIAASHFPPGRADALADPEFVRRYEERYRRSLGNQLPALGYDAANLVLNALPNRATTREALIRRFTLLAGLRGATGTFSVRAERVIRTPYLVVIREGRLAPAPMPYEYTLPVPKPPLPPDSAREGRR